MSSSEKQNETLILLSFNLTSLKENIILKRSLPEILRISCTLFTCPFSHYFLIDILCRVKDAYYQRAKTVAGLLDEELARLINDRQQRLAYTKLFYSEYTVNFVRAHGLIQVAFATKFSDKKMSWTISLDKGAINNWKQSAWMAVENLFFGKL